MNLLASVSVTSPQKGAKKMRKKRNRNDFGLGRGKLVKGGRISRQCCHIGRMDLKFKIVKGHFY